MWRISWNVSDTGHHNQWLTSSATPGTPVYEGSLRYKTVEALFDVSAWHVLSWSVLESGDFMWFWGCCIARNSWNMLEYVGICWNSHWTRPGFWMHTSRDFQVEHETWVDRNHGKRKIGRKTCLVQIPSTYPLLPSTKARCRVDFESSHGWTAFSTTRNRHGEVPGQLRGWYARDHYGHVWISDERPGQNQMLETRAFEIGWVRFGI